MIIHSFGDRPSIPALHHGGSISLTSIMEEDGEITFIEGLPVGRTEKHQIKSEDFVCGRLEHIAALLGGDRTLVVGTVEGMRSLLGRLSEIDKLTPSVEALQKQIEDFKRLIFELETINQGYLLANRDLAADKQALLDEIEGLRSDRAMLLAKIDELAAIPPEDKPTDLSGQIALIIGG